MVNSDSIDLNKKLDFGESQSQMSCKLDYIVKDNKITSVIGLLYQYCGDAFDLLDQEDSDEGAKRTIHMTLDNEGQFNAGLTTALVPGRLSGMVHTGCNLKNPERQGWSAVPIGIQFEIKL